MKRITWWPQLFLGLAFSWGALVGWTSQTGSLGLPPLLLYVGCILWTIGYDTIYALQDVEDDALIGVKSTARLFGGRAQRSSALFYAATVVLWVVAALLAGGGLAVPRRACWWSRPSRLADRTLSRRSGQCAGAIQGQPLGRTGADAGAAGGCDLMMQMRTLSERHYLLHKAREEYFFGQFETRRSKPD